MVRPPLSASLFNCVNFRLETIVGATHGGDGHFRYTRPGRDPRAVARQLTDARGQIDAVARQSIYLSCAYTVLTTDPRGHFGSALDDPDTDAGRLRELIG